MAFFGVSFKQNRGSRKFTRREIEDARNDLDMAVSWRNAGNPFASRNTFEANQATWELMPSLRRPAAVEAGLIAHSLSKLKVSNESPGTRAEAALLETEMRIRSAELYELHAADTSQPLNGKSGRIASLVRASRQRRLLGHFEAAQRDVQRINGAESKPRPRSFAFFDF